MEIDKKKYKQREVIEIINAYKIEYEAKLAEQKGRIFELSKENTELQNKIQKFKNKEKEMTSALIDAEHTAGEIKEKAELNYALEIERLKAFSARWDDYFSALKEKYPMYAPVNQAVEIKDRLDKFLKKTKKSGGTEELNQIIDAKTKKTSKKFDPKSKIDDYIAATEGNGFNMEEVLNPGELQLEDLCKELGLID